MLEFALLLKCHFGQMSRFCTVVQKKKAFRNKCLSQGGWGTVGRINIWFINAHKELVDPDPEDFLGCWIGTPGMEKWMGSRGSESAQRGGQVWPLFTPAAIALWNWSDADCLACACSSWWCSPLFMSRNSARCCKAKPRSGQRPGEVEESLWNIQ